MSWTPYYRGTGVPPENRDDRSVLPLPPPWRSSTGRRTTDPSRDPARTYRPAPGLVDAGAMLKTCGSALGLDAKGVPSRVID